MASQIIVILALILIVALTFLIIQILNNKNKCIDNKKRNYNDNTEMVNKQTKELVNVNKLPSDLIIKDEELMHITDKRLLANIASTSPKVSEVISAGKEISKLKKLDLYEVVLKEGQKLSNSRTMPGAKTTLIHNEAGKLVDNAKLISADDKMNKIIHADATRMAMNVGSAVVGQYYMQQINEELDVIKDDVHKIAEFQNAEYKGRVLSLLVQVQKASKFQMETIEIDEVRNRELDNLKRLEDECQKLLGQANFTLEAMTKSECKDYKQYTSKINEIQAWNKYQGSLTMILYKIADLNFTLYKGLVNRDYCYESYPIYLKQIEDINDKVKKWHNKSIEKFNINLDEETRKRYGLDAAIHFMPSLIDKKHKYTKLELDIKGLIEDQTSNKNKNIIKTDNKYKEDVKLIIKGGEVYYLPKN